jgi:hypothetical protein
MPTNIVQKLIVGNVLQNMIQLVNERQPENILKIGGVPESLEKFEMSPERSPTMQDTVGACQPLQITPDKISSETEENTQNVFQELGNPMLG